jgi:hypothetical protein
MTQIRLYDDTVINSENFEIHYTIARRLTVADMNNMRLAHKICANAPEYSVVIARKAHIVGLALGIQTGYEACNQAVAMMQKALTKEGRILLVKRAVAVLNFFPGMMDVIALSNAGIDVLFVLVSERGSETGTEQRIIDYWIYEQKRYKRKMPRDSREPITEYVWPRRVFIFPKWKAKDWEK